ncbi:MAG: MFS transporter, partial [Chloroflexi bacterium]|nr:MFS transporter [Chloroflexota bacterium]
MARSTAPALPAEAPAEAPASSVFNRNFLITGGAAFCYFLANFMYFATLPLYIQARGGSETDISLVIGASGALSLAARPFVGWLVDGVGRRTMLLTGALFAAASSAIFTVSVSLPLIVLGRGLNGIALASVTTSATTLINDTVALPRRGEANSYFGMAISMATGLGPPLGAFLVGAAFLQPVEGLLSGLFPAAAGAGNYSVMFVVGIILAFGSLTLAALVRDTYRPKGLGRGPNLRTMFSREAAITAVLNFSITVPFAAILSMAPIYAKQQGLGNPGVFFTVYSGMILVMRLVSGRASDRFGRPAVFLPGMALVGIAMLVLAASASPWGLLFAAALYGAGMGTAQPALTAYAADLAPTQRRGAAMSTFSLGFDLALSFGAWGLGFVVAQTGIAGALATAGAAPFLGIAYFGVQHWRQRGSR